MTFTIRTNHFLFILAAVAGSLTGCRDKAPAEEPAHEHEEAEGTVELSTLQYKSVGVVLGGIESRQLSGQLHVNGVLDVPPQNQVSISIPYGGILKYTDLLQGMWVNKGQVIARMEHPDYIQMQQEYLDAASQLSYLEKEYKRQEELSRENVSAAKTFEKTTADYHSLRVRVEALRQKLTLLNIRAANLTTETLQSSIPVISPISGYVTEVNANIGKFVQPNEVIFEIVDTRHLHVELMVFEKDVPKLRENQKVRFILANESTSREAEVHLIGREISAERTVRVHCHLLKEDKDLLPGMYVKATIETTGGQTDALPAEAVVSAAGKHYIFLQTVEEEGASTNPAEEHADKEEHEQIHFLAVEVGTGVSDDGFTEILLPEDFDRNTRNIVLKGAYDLLSKMNNSEEEGHHH
jgi:cobalt-zinc-cadmium efflux system membrane fusion protein